MSNANKNVNRLVIKLLITGVGMFAFALFVLPPMYEVFCDITGLNGKTGERYEQSTQTVNEQRTIRVQFIGKNNEAMPWQFRPNQTEIKVHPGQEVQVSYYARNPTENYMVAQAVPSLVPYDATDYFHKTECFCFSNQPLEGGHEAELVLRFIVDKDLPEHIHTLTLAYTMFDITEYSDAAKAAAR
ncbi:cytochrome c oxidase assembly protein [Halioxenophilus sp. WMMB6]|uniref:cytochrome c oxidase assembly protein n=1 Tax=Halioxenophilus sp. WMMB6 TaxID=3073815 RepID=UPI00295E6DA0|nr:cytochrome c oxidase assembly protein [Halioxenophilus sp. WMMB6]